MPVACVMLSRMLCIGVVTITGMLTPKPEKQSACSGAARCTLVLKISLLASHDSSQMVLGGTTNKMCPPVEPQGKDLAHAGGTADRAGHMMCVTCCQAFRGAKSSAVNVSSAPVSPGRREAAFADAGLPGPGEKFPHRVACWQEEADNVELYCEHILSE